MNSLTEIINFFDFEKLLNEGRNPFEVLHYKFGNDVPSDVIDTVIAIDPTKRKTYSVWLLNKWNDEEKIIKKCLANGRIKKLFDYYKAHSNEIQITNCPSVKVGLAKYVPEEESILDKSESPKTYLINTGGEVDSSLANDFDIVYNDGSWVIAVPNTYEAECKLGENMKWCTANSYGDGENYYNHYLEVGGKYYVNFDMSKEESRNGKDYPFTRYQFHFETHQFMNKEDKKVNPFEIGMPEGAFEFYENEGYSESAFKDKNGIIQDYENLWSQDAYTLVEDCFFLNTAYDIANHEYVEPNNETPFYIYSYDDVNDPICSIGVINPHVNRVTVEYDEDNYYILKAVDGSKLLFTNESDGNFAEWYVFNVIKYWNISDEYNGFFCLRRVVRSGKYLFMYSCINGHASDSQEAVSTDIKNVFINHNITDYYSDSTVAAVEVVYGDGYHSLYLISLNAEDNIISCVVRKDIPAEENDCFYIDENSNLIVGKILYYKP